MAHRFAKVSQEEIEEAFFYPSDLVDTKTTTPLRVGEEQWICFSSIFTLQFVFELGQNSLNWYNFNCTSEKTVKIV